jgi:hypothetical protein
MNTLIYMFHFRLHNSTTHLSNVMKLSQSFENQWKLLCWKYKINEFYFRTNTRSTNLRIHELVILTKPRKLIPTKKSSFTVFRKYNKLECHLQTFIWYTEVWLFFLHSDLIYRSVLYTQWFDIQKCPLYTVIWYTEVSFIDSDLI